MRKLLGDITHYYNKLGVAVLRLDGDLKVGDLIHISGHTTDFVQRVGSMEVDHRKVPMLGPGSEGALQVVERCRRGDRIYLVSEDWAEDIDQGSCSCFG